MLPFADVKLHIREAFVLSKSLRLLHHSREDLQANYFLCAKFPISRCPPSIPAADVEDGFAGEIHLREPLQESPRNFVLILHLCPFKGLRSGPMARRKSRGQLQVGFCDGNRWTCAPYRTNRFAFLDAGIHLPVISRIVWRS